MTRTPLRRLITGFCLAALAAFTLATPAVAAPDTGSSSGSGGSGSSSGSGSGSGSGSSSGSAALPLPSPAGLGALAAAVTQTGKPYEWGSEGPHSWDCSALVQWAYAQVGVRLPRTTWEQAEVGVEVPRYALSPGDVVILNADASHVGIYAGFGQIFNAYGRGVPVGLAPLSQFQIYSIRRF
ncbi:C40 family peptidase [Nocardia cyriacigeorgica]|uniref:Probable endopeptidase cgR_2070 n=1 Tax=Nocardia cyriacigeorgica TaxID=135487 RepID=A0A4U8W5E6_9NOCA|nr:Probable endopeptidase cgR_2070 precursor [Nocardia cyriacigeorgica]